MKKAIVFFISVVILCSICCFPQNLKANDILTSPEYWYQPGNTFNYMYNASPANPLPPSSPSVNPGTLFAPIPALVVVAILDGSFLLFFLVFALLGVLR